MFYESSHEEQEALIQRFQKMKGRNEDIKDAAERDRDASLMSAAGDNKLANPLEKGVVDQEVTTTTGINASSLVIGVGQSQKGSAKEAGSQGRQSFQAYLASDDDDAQSIPGTTPSTAGQAARLNRQSTQASSLRDDNDSFSADLISDPEPTVPVNFESAAAAAPAAPTD